MSIIMSYDAWKTRAPDDELLPEESEELFDEQPDALCREETQTMSRKRADAVVTNIKAGREVEPRVNDGNGHEEAKERYRDWGDYGVGVGDRDICGEADCEFCLPFGHDVLAPDETDV